MDWITKMGLGNLTESNSQSESLRLAKKVITKWCKENNMNGSIHNASAVNCRNGKARYLSITTVTKRWYVYQLIISRYTKVIDKEYIGVFFGKPIYKDILDDKNTYYARLVKVNNISGLDASNVEILNEVK